MSRSVRYTSSPLLASKTPVLHSRIVVGMLTLVSRPWQGVRLYDAGVCE